jgi:hypothetical protein
VARPLASARLGLLGLAIAAAAAAQPERFQIVTADAATVTYRELVAPQVAVDEAAGVFHYRGCLAITPGMPWLPPGAATLRGYRAHCLQLRKPEYATRTEPRAARDPGVISLLFLGNSLTYYNEMPAMTEALARGEGRPLRVDAVTRSGVTLGQIWNETTALRDLWRRHWDYVVLQGGAGAAHPLFNASEFDRDLARLASEVRRSGATPLFYLVWRPDVPAEFEAASLASARRAGLRVVPAGIAWRELVESRRFARLDWDGLHPDTFGAYLVACTVYSTIYGRAARGAPPDFRPLASADERSDEALRQQSLGAADARALQDAAWKAVQQVR